MVVGMVHSGPHEGGEGHEADDEKVCEPEDAHDEHEHDEHDSGDHGE